MKCESHWGRWRTINILSRVVVIVLSKRWDAHLANVCSLRDGRIRWELHMTREQFIA